LVLIPEAACPACFVSKTSDLHDADGRRLSAAAAMHRYMQPARRRSNPIVWYAHSSLDTVARLTLSPEDRSCRATLLFTFSWYGAQFFVVIPVDGDSESRPSNLRLEELYLDRLAKSIVPPR
jgi:hypothetical protein